MKSRYKAALGHSYVHDHVQGAWTCMWCGMVNVFVWDEEGSEFKTPITMLCDFCDGGTFMERKLSEQPSFH